MSAQPTPIPASLLRSITTMEALAAFGALQRARAEGLTLPTPVEAALLRVVEAAELPTEGDAAGGPSALGMVRALFQQGWELLADPAREPGWQSGDPQLLQAQGRASAQIPPLLDANADAEPAFASALRRPGTRILDVGTGVAWLALSAARTWPEARVLGIDIWEPALGLARQNVAASGLSGRVDLARADVRDFTSEEPFDVVWLPGPFLDRPTLEQAAEVCRRLLRSGGWVVLGCYAGRRDPLSEALSDLRTVRSGGVPLDLDAVRALFGAAGFAGIRKLPLRTPAPMRFYLARAP